jgi:hypothetical protein
MAGAGGLWERTRRPIVNRAVCCSARGRGSQAVAPWLTSKIYETVDESVAEPAACWGKARPLQPLAQLAQVGWHRWRQLASMSPPPAVLRQTKRRGTTG